jgi:chemotaxis protein MotB
MRFSSSSRLPLLAAALALPLLGCTELQQLRNRSDIQDREIARLQASLQEWRDGWYQLDEEREEQVAERDEIIRERESQIQRLQTSQTEQEVALRARVSELEAELGRTKTSMALQSTEHTTLQAQRDSLARELAEAEADVTALTARLNQVQGTLGSMQQETTQAVESETQMRQEWASQRQSLEAAIAERDATITTLRNRILEMQGAQGGEGGGTAIDPAELDRIESHLRQTLETTEGPKPTFTRDAARGVIVTFANADLFESRMTVVLDSAERPLMALAHALAQLGDVSVLVVGHTDNEPLRNLPFRDNWQLSALRAESVLRALLENSDLSPENCLFAAAGQHHPVTSNGTADGRAANRRVEIIVRPAP